MNTFNWIYLFAFIGVLDTLYLIYHKLRGTNVACPFFPKEWCYKVQHSPQSVTFGIPNSMAGFGMYVLIIILTYLASTGGLSIVYLKSLVMFGFLFSLYFVYVQAFVLRAFCTWCVVSFINFAVMTYLLFV